MADASIPPAKVLALYDHCGGRAWEPKNMNSLGVDWLIAEGFVKRVDGICGFERFKDSMLSWTLAGKLACEAIRAKMAAAGE